MNMIICFHINTFNTDEIKCAYLVHRCDMPQYFMQQKLQQLIRKEAQ